MKLINKHKQFGNRLGGLQPPVVFLLFVNISIAFLIIIRQSPKYKVKCRVTKSKVFKFVNKEGKTTNSATRIMKIYIPNSGSNNPENIQDSGSCSHERVPTPWTLSRK